VTSLTADPDRPALLPGEAVENYTKAIHALQLRGAGPVTTNALAQRLGITASSVSAMFKKLDRLGLVERAPYQGVRLTAQGERIALAVIRKHRLLETFLVEQLGVSWDRVHREAEVLEHYVSDQLAARIAEKLDHPERDPHGDPIPGSAGAIDDEKTARLGELQPGARGTFVRVSDAEPAMLRHLGALGIAPGAPLEVLGREPFGGPTVIRIDGTEHALGLLLADAMRIRLASDRPEP